MSDSCPGQQLKGDGSTAVVVDAPSGLRRGVLLLLNAILHVAHCALMAFSVVGWMFPATRWATLWVLLLIGFSWYGIGAFRKDIGYCLITDMQWRVKRGLGESPPEDGYVKYLADLVTGRDIRPAVAHVTTVCVYFISLIACIWLLLRHH